MSVDTKGYVYFQDGSAEPITEVNVYNDNRIWFATCICGYLYVRTGPGDEFMFYKDDFDDMVPVKHLIDHIEISKEYYK